MKLVISLLFIHLIGYCQPKLFSSYNIFEKYNKESNSFEKVKVENDRIVVWEVYFDRVKGEVIIADSAAKGYYEYKIISSEIEGIKTIMKVNIESISNEDNVILVFYRNEYEYVFEEITPKNHFRRRRMITSS